MSKAETDTSALVASAQRLAVIRNTVGEDALRLACHAAIPVVVDAGLLNLLRVNFFLDDPPDVLPFEAEAELLLSPLCREIGEGLYEIEPSMRNLLLSELQGRYGSARVHRVAALLQQYTDASSAWRSLPQLELAQQLTALSFLDPAGAQRWLDEHEASAARPSSPSTGGPSRDWYVAMRRQVAGNSAVATVGAQVRETGQALLQLASSGGIRARLSLIRDLETLAVLPDTDTDAVVTVLCAFIHQWDKGSPGLSKQVTPDVQAALTLIGSVPHAEFRLEGVTLIGANLAGLDFGYASFDRVTLIELDALGINLAHAHFNDVVLSDANLNSALLNDAVLEFRSLHRVSLEGVSCSGAYIAAGVIHELRASKSDGAPLDIIQYISEDELSGTPGALFSGPSKEPLVNVDTLLFQAQTAERMGQWHVARDAYRAILDFTGTKNDEARQGLVRCFFQLEEPYEAVRLLQDVLASYEDPVQSDATDVLVELGQALLRMRRFQSAASQFSVALASAHAANHPILIAQAEAGLGASLAASYRYGEAEEHYRTALEYFTSMGVLESQGITCIALAGLLIPQGRFAEATDYASRGLAAFRELGDSGTEAASLSQIADAFATVEEHGRAVMYYTKAYEANAKAHGRNAPDTVSIGRSLAKELTLEADRLWADGRYTDADFGYHAATGYAPDFAAAQSGLGNGLLHQARYQEALITFFKALNLDPHDARARHGIEEARKRFPSDADHALRWRDYVRHSADSDTPENHMVDDRGAHHGDESPAKRDSDVEEGSPLSIASNEQGDSQADYVVTESLRIRIDNALLVDLGLGSLPAALKRVMLKYIYDTLEERVGTDLASQMSKKQLDEFESLIFAQGDSGALQWLNSNLPEYKTRVRENFALLKEELRHAAPVLLRSF